ncbi:MAG: amidohydrolase [Lautropia sp.]
MAGASAAPIVAVDTRRPAWSPVIDTHAHVFARDLPLVTGATHQPERDYTVEDYLTQLDAEGVAFGVLTAPSFLGTYNDYALAALHDHPRLRATAIVEPGIDPYVLRAMDRDGFVGIRYSLRRYPTLPDFSAPEFRPLLRRVCDLDWYVHILAESERLATMIPPLRKAGVKLVIDHFGVPDPAQGPESAGLRAVLDALEAGNTWMKLSGPYRIDGLDATALARRCLEICGPDRLLWGSDWPWTAHEGRFTYRDTIRWFEEWIPDPAIRDAIGRAGLRINKFI